MQNNESNGPPENARVYLRDLKALVEQCQGQTNRPYTSDLVTSIVAKILRDGRLSTAGNYAPSMDNDSFGTEQLLKELERVRAEWDIPAPTPSPDLDTWITARYSEHALSPCIRKLVEKRDVLEAVYAENAVLRLPPYLEAILLCLQACEEDRPDLLAEIDPTLYLENSGHKDLWCYKGTSHSLPTILVNTMNPVDFDPVHHEWNEGSDGASSHISTCRETACETCISDTIEHLVRTVIQMGFSENTGINLSKSPAKMVKANTTPVSGSSHRRSRSDIPFTFTSKPESHHVSPGSGSFKTDGNEYWGDKTMGQALEAAKKTLLDIRLKILENSIEEERENSHFQLSEMLIAAVEQMKWRQVLAHSNVAHLSPFASPFASPIPRTPTPGEEHVDTSTLPSQYGQGSATTGYASSEDVYPHSEVSLASHDESGSSVGLGYSGEQSSISPFCLSPVPSGEVPSSSRDEPIRRQLETSQSAEAVAAQLMKNISNLAKREQPKFFVSYKDAKQYLLPLPEATEFPISPDEISGTVRTERGNSVWAPPREQLIFTLHPSPKLKTQLLEQRNRCAGCGRKLERIYVKRVRYCEYLGKFFCQVCHIGSQSLIPSRMIHRWDFHLFPVSDFAKQFLSNHFHEPLLNVNAINPGLYQSVKPLKLMQVKRKHLRLMWDYVRTCRTAVGVITRDGKLGDLFERLPKQFLEEGDFYSMKDLLMIKEGTLDSLVNTTLYYARCHIEACEFCGAKGFLCELCQDGAILFPFQTERIHRCSTCGTCFHIRCFRSLRSRKAKCPRCDRIEKRRRAAESEAMKESRARTGSNDSSAEPLGVD